MKIAQEMKVVRLCVCMCVCVLGRGRKGERTEISEIDHRKKLGCSRALDPW